MKHAIFTKPLTVSITEEQYAMIKEISDQKRISMAEWFRQVLDQILAGNHNTGGIKDNGLEESQ